MFPSTSRTSTRVLTNVEQYQLFDEINILKKEKKIVSTVKRLPEIKPKNHKETYFTKEEIKRMSKNERKIIKKKPSNLQERLALAAKEASLEIKINNLQKKLHKKRTDLEQTEEVLESAEEEDPLEKRKNRNFQAFTSLDGFTNISQMSAKELAAEIARRTKLQKEKEELESKRLQEQLERNKLVILEKKRAQKAMELQQMKEDAHAEELLKKQFLDQHRTKEMRERLIHRQELRQKEETEMKEKLRIRELKLIKRSQEEREAERYAEKLEQEWHRIRTMVGEKEAAEIFRGRAEEARMQYLEEVRRRIEDRLEHERELLRQVEAEKAQRALLTTQTFEGRLRRGNFMWHNGEYGYYDRVRKEPPEYVQYEDENGVPYYYDPLRDRTQYRTPADSNIHHYTDDERKEYDAVYGEGAYDAMKADIAFKEYVNQYGGYYNELGHFVKVFGYYDQNYEWVQDDGYVNDDGQYVRFAKAEGHLDFMV